MRCAIAPCAALVFAMSVPAFAQDSPRFVEARERMVKEDIAKDGFFGRRGVTDTAVLNAMRTVPRHEFVSESQQNQAYADTPLPIGHGQTISQPYIVALMTELLDVDADDVVLEIGTGSGYQAAVLAEIVEKVFTIEIVEPLAMSAKKRLAELEYDNVETKSGDGYFGWKEHAPYDGIVVTAAASHIPPPLVEQLKPGARMVIPVGPPFGNQQLFLLEKNPDGTVTQRSVLAVRFVPLTRGEAVKDESSE
ncbi:MAG: protein-L-isoaspartate(D-aspartate) O-methyltransferase [Candidatus Hydrogenedentes bacterium]|nr:protein-L-isoaspartate(D-aspartate) O-methyltransferase [Candidatus Hydrogenedentota bacterium]